MRRPTAIWLAAVTTCIVVGAVIGAGGGPLRPRHFGYYLAAASLVAGLLFGLRGVALPVVGIAAFGVLSLVQYSADSRSAEDQTGILIGAYWIYFPVLFATVAAFGAALRRVLLSAYRRLRNVADADT